MTVLSILRYIIQLIFVNLLSSPLHLSQTDDPTNLQTPILLILVSGKEAEISSSAWWTRTTNQTTTDQKVRQFFVNAAAEVGVAGGRTDGCRRTRCTSCSARPISAAAAATATAALPPSERPVGNRHSLAHARGFGIFRERARRRTTLDRCLVL